MKLEVTKLELIKLKKRLKKYKKINFDKKRDTKLITMGSYNSVDISYLAINRFIKEEFFYSLIKAKNTFLNTKPIRLISDTFIFHSLDYEKIDENIRLTINKFGGIETFSYIYEILNEINIDYVDFSLERSKQTNWESIRDVLNFYKRNLRNNYTILNDLMAYNRIYFNFGKCFDNITYYDPITNRYFLRIEDNKTILKNVILAHELMHILLTKDKTNNILSDEVKPIVAEKIYIKELSEDFTNDNRKLYFVRNNDTNDKIRKLKYICEFLLKYNIQSNKITKNKIEDYMIENNMIIQQILAIFEWIKYENILSSLEYIYSDVVSTIIVQSFNKDVLNMDKYFIKGNIIEDIIKKLKNSGYIGEYNNFTKNIKEKIK